ncbi:MAG TPA: hypothetical protein VJS20_08675, partial [Gemmatimonadales bacterium]|nr:hypothetical protein [Gemmatimonadales bacterium]
MRSTLILAGALLITTALPATAQMTTRLSKSTGNINGNLSSVVSASCLSGDSRYVVYQSDAYNLVSGDSNGALDIFLRDRLLGVTTRISVDSSGQQANDSSRVAYISQDGRWVTFESSATNLVTGDTNAVKDIFIRDLVQGTTERISLAWNGAQADGDSAYANPSAAGNLVVFHSSATNLVPADTNGVRDVFLRDRDASTTECVSRGALGLGNADSSYGAVSADGRLVVFSSEASNLVVGDSNQYADIFLRDRVIGTTVRISIGPSGEEADGDSQFPLVTPDGRFVLFNSHANNLVANDTNSSFDQDVFVRDLQAGTTERVNVGPAGQQGFGAAGGVAITPEGRYV